MPALAMAGLTGLAKAAAPVLPTVPLPHRLDLPPGVRTRIGKGDRQRRGSRSRSRSDCTVETRQPSGVRLPKGCTSECRLARLSGCADLPSAVCALTTATRTVDRVHTPAKTPSTP